MNDLLTFLAGVAAGHALASLRAYLHTKDARSTKRGGMRTVSARTWATDAPLVMSFDRRQQWRVHMLRFICLNEHVTRKRGNHPDRLPSRYDLHDATGETWRAFQPYWEALESGGIVENRGRAGRVWLAGYTVRREAVGELPYPSVRPKPFRFVPPGVP